METALPAMEDDEDVMHPRAAAKIDTTAPATVPFRTESDAARRRRRRSADPTWWADVVCKFVNLSWPIRFRFHVERPTRGVSIYIPPSPTGRWLEVQVDEARSEPPRVA
jgi:hypothetical protein